MPEETEKYYNSIAEEYAENHSFEQMPDEVEVEYKRVLDGFLDEVGSGRILDAGCGHGRDAGYFAERGFQVVGIDVSGEMVEVASGEHPDVSFQQMDVTDLDLKSGGFDAVWCNTVLQFLPEKEVKKALEQFDRVLTPQGLLCTTFKVGGEHTEPEPQRYTIDEEKALEMLQEAGFRSPDKVEEFSLNGMDVIRVYTRKKQ